MAHYTAVSRFLKSFCSPVCYAFAYGSAIFPQATASSRLARMADMIFVVDDPIEWHRSNLKQYGHHYPYSVRIFGPKYAARLQAAAAGAFFLPFIPFDFAPTLGEDFNFQGTEGQITGAKYGIVSCERFTQDLCQWDTFFFAGRLQKPVLWLSQREEPSLDAPANLTKHVASNRMAAARLALLMQPPGTFVTMTELLQTIVGLSYRCDPRMSIPCAEDAGKVKNIVKAQKLELQSIYAPLLDEVCHSMSGMISRHLRGLEVIYAIAPMRDCGSDDQQRVDFLRAKEISRLPQKYTEALGAYIRSPNLAVREMEAALSDIARWTATKQALKGIATAGFLRSARYVAAKMQKSVTSMFDY